MQFEVVVPSKNIPAFAAAIQCLGKIGKELFLEVNTESVRRALRSRSAVCVSRRQLDMPSGVPRCVAPAA
jgi:hypothetical protein